MEGPDITLVETQAVWDRIGDDHPFAAPLRAAVRAAAELDGADLVGIALLRGVGTLVDNWTDASRDTPCHPSRFYSDLDDLLVRLQNVRDALEPDPESAPLDYLLHKVDRP